MKSKATKIIAALLVVALAGWGVKSIFFTPKQDVHFEKTQDVYRLTASHMSDEDTHAIHLDGGDSLEVVVKVDKGDLNFHVMAPDGTKWYTGNHMSNAHFELISSISGEYTISTIGKDFSGTIDVVSIRP